MEENNLNANDALRSENSNKKAYLRIVNCTNLTVEIVWINYRGHYIRYQLLRRRAYVDIDTYETHPWIALDVHTRDRLSIGGKFFYMPRASEGPAQDNPNLVRPLGPSRRIVCVTLPLYSLRYLALLASRNLFEQPEEADELDVPGSLRDDLKRAISLRNKNMTKDITQGMLQAIL